ncbi:MAG: hypothetical protein H0X36_00295 [Sphingomonadaceae bacterium]|nr:hypothetical protein [Sphingomonadaceae bacterium]
MLNLSRIETEIKLRVAQLIDLERRDGEAVRAGSEELRNEVLRAIADGERKPRTMALAARQTIEQAIGHDSEPELPLFAASARFDRPHARGHIIEVSDEAPLCRGK